MKQSFQILGLGAACMDLIVPISEVFLLTVPGEKGGAEAIALEELNKIIQDSGVTPTLITGGSCANAMKGLASLGTKCALLSKIGHDELGEHVAHHMRQTGVIPLFSKGQKPTARVLCLITPDGQRTMRFFAGSSEEMKDHDLHPDYFHGVKLVHIDAYSLRNDHIVERMVKLAKGAQALVSMDLSSFEIIQYYHKRIYALLKESIDIVFANKDETKAMTGLEDSYEGCRKLQEWCSIAIVLMGHEGCLVGHRNEIFQSPAFPVQVIDTTGAGDLFASGFLYGYLQNLPLKTCARLGNLLGGAATEITGAEIPEAKWKEIRPFIQMNSNY